MNVVALKITNSQQRGSVDCIMGTLPESKSPSVLVRKKDLTECVLQLYAIQYVTLHATC